MLKKDFRLRKKKDFENVFNTGIYFSERFLALKMTENQTNLSRFAFIVSNKISKKATKRNKTRRLLRESVRLSQKKIRSGFDIVFISKNGITNKNFEEINNYVDKLLRKSGLLKK